MNSRRRWWFGVALGGAILAAALLLLSWQLRGMERERFARLEEERNLEEPLRLALWRLDTWLALQLAPEGSRPYFEYKPYYPNQRAYNRMLGQLAPGEVFTPSPLLSSRSPFIRLHFEIRPLGDDLVIQSPQVPTGNLADLAEGTLLDPHSIAASRAVLEPLREQLVRGTARTRIEELLAADPDQLAPWESGERPIDAGGTEQADRSAREWNRRTTIAKQQVQARKNTLDDPAPFYSSPTVEVHHGALAPLWLESAAEPTLCFIRLVDVGGQRMVQGFLTDWQALRTLLLAQIEDLFPGASLEPAFGISLATDQVERRMATLPAVLRVTQPASRTLPFWTTSTSILTVTWITALIAFLAVARTLRASIAFGEQRSRFASAVTHELRTPLTTLQMYSEMLADGLVKDERARTEYQQTIRDESIRLANLVENVLSFSRLESGRHEAHATETDGRTLLDSALPALQRRARSADLRLVVNDSDLDDVKVVAHPDVVGQILLNLVDNACKYAIPSDPEEIHLDVGMAGPSLVFTVRDFGPGIPAQDHRRVFDPFERGADADDHAQGGVGLGLALSRGLARDLGGELTFEDADPGTRFRLVLPGVRGT